MYFDVWYQQTKASKGKDTHRTTSKDVQESTQLVFPAWCCFVVKNRRWSRLTLVIIVIVVRWLCGWLSLMSEKVNESGYQSTVVHFKRRNVRGEHDIAQLT